MTVELTHGLCQRLLYDTPVAVWYLATVLWRSLTYPLPLNSCCPSFYVTSSIVAVKSRAAAISQWRDGLCLPAWTCRVLICWSSSWRAFVRTDGYFWMCSAQDGPVASCLGLNGQADPLWPGCCDSLISLCRHTVVSCSWGVSYSALEKQNCHLLIIETWRHCQR